MCHKASKDQAVFRPKIKNSFSPWEIPYFPPWMSYTHTHWIPVTSSNRYTANMFLISPFWLIFPENIQTLLNQDFNCFSSICTKPFKMNECTIPLYIILFCKDWLKWSVNTFIVLQKKSMLFFWTVYWEKSNVSTKIWQNNCFQLW